jgi:hypothetical protein
MGVTPTVGVVTNRTSKGAKHMGAQDTDVSNESDTADRSESENGQGATEKQATTQATEKPEPSKENKEQAAEMMKAYEQNQSTLVMPGSGKTIAGTAVNDWLDDDGNPKFAKDGDSQPAGADADGASAEKAAGARADDDAPADRRSEDDTPAEKTGRDGAAYQSERSAAADQTAGDADKSVEQLEQEARQRAEENFEPDKEFNQAVREAAKQQESA